MKPGFVRAALLPVTLSALLLAAPAVVHADEAPTPKPLWVKKPTPRGLSFGGKLFTTMAPDLVMKGPYEDRFEWHSGLDFRVKYRFAKNARFQLEAKARYDMRFGDRTEVDFLVDLGDSYLQFKVGKLTVRTGRMTMKWGQNALLGVLDRLNPSDYTRALGGAGLDDPKIPVLAIKATLNLNPLALEAVYIPFFQPQRAVLYGRDFAAMRPGLLEEMLPKLAPTTGSGLVNQQLASVTDRLKDELAGSDPYARDGIQSYLIADLPEELPWHGDLGARVGYTGRGFDLDGYVLWHIVDRPLVHLHDAVRLPLLQNRMPNQNELTRLMNPDTQLLRTEYKRSIMGGMDVAIAVGDFVLSAEAAAFEKTVHYRRTLEPYLSPMVRYAVELRYSAGSTFTLTAGAGHDIIIRPTVDTLMESQHHVAVTLVAVLRLFRERVQVLASASWSPDWGDIYIHPRLTIEIEDGVQAIFGLQLFQSYRPDATNSLAGFLAYRGGPIGYFRANDYAYGMLQMSF